jgi:hypothetical protein
MENQSKIKAVTKIQNKTSIYVFEDEKDFFSLINRRLMEQGYQCLTTLKRLRKTNTLVLLK